MPTLFHKFHFFLRLTGTGIIITYWEAKEASIHPWEEERLMVDWNYQLGFCKTNVDKFKTFLQDLSLGTHSHIFHNKYQMKMSVASLVHEALICYCHTRWIGNPYGTLSSTLYMFKISWINASEVSVDTPTSIECHPHLNKTPYWIIYWTKRHSILGNTITFMNCDF